MASNAGEDVVLAEDEDGMKASAVPNQTLVSHCSLVTLWDGVLVAIVTYTARPWMRRWSSGASSRPSKPFPWSSVAQQHIVHHRPGL